MDNKLEEFIRNIKDIESLKEFLILQMKEDSKWIKTIPNILQFQRITNERLEKMEANNEL